MKEAVLVGQQIILIYIYITIGILCSKKKIITHENGRAFSNFLLVVVTPCLMIKSYMRPLEIRHLLGLLLAFLLAFLFHILAIIISGLLIKKRDDAKYLIERMGAIYSNCGFMAIPLIAATVGEIGIFYAVAFISIFNIVIWSHGVMMMTGQKKFKLRPALFNPGVIGFMTGLFIYCLQLRIPAIIDQAVTGIAALNTPLAMITTGAFLAHIQLKALFNDRHIYYASMMRLVILPLVMLVLVKLLGTHTWMQGADKVIMASMLACAAPAAASITLFPAKFGLEGSHGAKIIALSTLFSIVTLPLVTFVTRIWAA